MGRAYPWKGVLATAGTLGLLAALAVVVSLLDIPVSDPQRLQAWVQGYGVWAPVVVTVLQVVQVVVVPVPNQASAIAAGFFFGIGPGTLYTAVGTGIGSGIAFLLGRRIGRPVVELVVPVGKVDRFDELMARHGSIALTVMFLLPAFPGDLLCYLGGMSRMRGRVFLAVVLLGRGPKFLLYNVIGYRLASGGVAATLPYIAPLVVLAAVTVWKRDQLETLLERVDAWSGSIYP